jgi:hypothetical protein
MWVREKNISEMKEGSKDCSREVGGSGECGAGLEIWREKGFTGRRIDRTEGHEISNEAGRQHKLEGSGRKAKM